MEKIFNYKNPKYRMGNAINDRSKGKMADHTIPAYRTAPHVWNVGGQDDVAVYLLDTGDGLILIDTGYEATLYLLVDRIWRTGHDPKDIRKILLTHYHGDHSQGVAGLVEMSGAEVWLSAVDEENHQRTKDSDFPMPVIPYKVDRLYDDDVPIVMGRFTIKTRLTPGHTWGATSFFFDDTDDETGITYHCAVHGGMGTAMMKPGTAMAQMENMTPEGAERFIADCLDMADMDIDINMASHLNQANIDENLPEDLDDYTWFVNDYSWHDMMINRAEEVMSYFPDRYPDLVRTVETLG